MRRRVGAFVGLLVVAAIATQPPPAALAQPEAILEGRAVLPADTFAGEPPSGSKLEDETKGGRTPPFEGQPVGGISAVLEAGDGEFQAMPDNGFGKKGNSSDFQLRTYRIRPDFETAKGGSGEISYGEFVQLRDPDRRIPFEITNEDLEDRLLTGADFDIESVRREAQGGLWFGDEFGPFLLHTDATGRVLEAPIPLPDVKSPENPNLEAEEEPTLPTSKGFEGMAISEDEGTLYPMLEGALEDDQEASRRYVYEFDLGSKSYTGERWQYRVEASDNSIGDFTALGGGRFLVIERDNEQGEEAGFKKVYEVDLNREDSEGYLVKEEVLDLLSIRDPDRISGPGREGDIGLGDPFSFPFQTIESILPLGDGRLLLLNDNNYPLSAGRNPDQPDDTEAIIVRTGALSPSPTEMPGTGGPPLLVLAGSVLVAVVGAAWMLLQRRVTAVAVRRYP
ncbi:MAG: Glycerophosphoryl diester phosphodiesterase [uncultured Rubrobacteraceae bacterium]|uniref:Glycerophosphoryl diester phosphodiesterase n=1 Tax=uncultured Rubrobacteraceae bacterium TaxID=349277 RepID=A0A6J4PY96_9ACTN|nr:MAG: Glycerophosphoryl diester phosphodiesterase [uncultured Rubrobacteraceae bacterium]